MQGAEFPPKGEQYCGDAVIPRDGTAVHTTEGKKMDVEEIIGFDALFDSMIKCLKGVTWKDTPALFMHYWAREIRKLEKELHDGTYRERKGRYFTITEPTVRVIKSVAFRDRIYQRSLNDVAIYPAVTKSFIYDNHACQKGKGTRKARERMECFLHRFYRHHGADGYVLKCDIKGYYPNMRHDVAKEVLRKYLDAEVFKMAADILDNFPGEVGFNPGSQIVQIVGLAALNGMDHYIKEQLGIKYYQRTTDDFILICESKEKLEHCLECIKKILAAMHMELNPKKTKILKLKDGFKYLGFYYFLTDSGKVFISIDPKKVKHERRKLRRMAALVKKGEKSKEKVDEHYESWKVHASYGNSYKLIKRMDEFYESLWKEDDNADQETKRNSKGNPGAGTDGGEDGAAGSSS